MTKHIFVTGGVASGLGKGITGSSLGRLLKARGLRVTMQKFDPYINVDPGTMNPFEHGEVFVTDDGGETDLDLGHYERFFDEPLTKDSNATTGSIYQAVLAAERHGDYLGKTVQVIPHITDEIKRRIRRLATADTDVVITEVGGTAGDIEILPFLEAIRQMRLDAGRGNVCYVHVTLVPFIGPSGEQKTKPTQHSVTELRSRGIQPDAVVLRSEEPIDTALREKISRLCDVELSGGVNAPDASNLYEVPLTLHEEGLDRYICDILGIADLEPDLRSWSALVERIEDATSTVRIGIIGKYVSLPDAYMSVVEALRHGGYHHGAEIDIDWIQAEDVEGLLASGRLAPLDGMIIPGGFGERGIEGKIEAIRFARERQIPFFGICLGMQCAVIEFARNVAELDDANSTEFDKETSHPVICLLNEQRSIVEKGGTMRLGAQTASLDPTSHSSSLYQADTIEERHRHRYEFNNAYRHSFQAHGMRFAGTNPDGTLVEIIELKEHPWMVAVQFHPEFKSKPTDPHPLFAGFIEASLGRHLTRADRAAKIDVPVDEA